MIARECVVGRLILNALESYADDPVEQLACVIGAVHGWQDADRDAQELGPLEALEKLAAGEIPDDLDERCRRAARAALEELHRVDGIAL